MNLLHHSAGIFILFSIVPVQVVSSGCPFEVGCDSDATQMFHPVAFLILLHPPKTSLQALRQTDTWDKWQGFSETLRPTAGLCNICCSNSTNTQQVQAQVLGYTEIIYIWSVFYVLIDLLNYLCFSPFVPAQRFLCETDKVSPSTPFLCQSAESVPLKYHEKKKTKSVCASSSVTHGRQVSTYRCSRCMIMASQ